MIKIGAKNVHENSDIGTESSVFIDDDQELEEEWEVDNGSTASDLRLYQCILFLLTQVGYVAVAPSMLSTTFFEPTPQFCITQTRGESNATRIDFYSTAEFRSLLVEWNEHCHHSRLTISISASVMVGAILGAFIAGYFADRFGRKPVVVGSMLLICFGNTFLAILGTYGFSFALVLFFLVGLACGGYMVTNMVLLVEILRHSSTRMLVVSLNGWPLGMLGTAVLAYTLRHWRLYHICVAIFSLIFFIVMQSFAFESIPWLIQSGRSRRAITVQRRLTRVNSFFDKTNRDSNRKRETEINNLPRRVRISLSENEKNNAQLPCVPTADSSEVKTYTYFDLFRHRSIAIRLLTLLFCFGSTSIISFGLYFSAEVLPGSRNANLAIMGLSKLVMGFLPFVLSNWMGRRPILLASLSVASIACWTLIISWILFDLSKHWIITTLGLIITAAIDPNWKMIHLFSMELFPTPVRNMARALCNVIARLGSLAGPWVLILRLHNELLPFWVFGCLLAIQLLVSFCFLPETRGKPLPEHMPDEPDLPSQSQAHSPSPDQKQFRKRAMSRLSQKSIRSRAYSVDIPCI